MSSELTSFTPFSALPFEIRAQIWRLVAPGRRMVAILYRPFTKRYTSRTTTPVILRVNHESRQEGRRIYHELHAGGRLHVGCYMNLKKDTIYLKCDLSVRKGPDVPWMEGEEIGDGVLITQALLDVASHRAISISNPVALYHEQPAFDLSQTRNGLGPAPAAILWGALRESLDAEAIFAALHIESKTWKLIGGCKNRGRREASLGVGDKLRLVFEYGDGPLHIPLQLRKPAEWRECKEGEDTTSDRELSVIKTIHSYHAQHSLFNRRDVKEGLAPVLPKKTIAYILDRGVRQGPADVIAEESWL